MSQLMSQHSRSSVGFPRVSGDEPVTDAATDFIRWFSPREWG